MRKHPMPAIWPRPALNQILVLYDSRSGNVAKMAALVAEGAGQVTETEMSAAA